MGDCPARTLSEIKRSQATVMGTVNIHMTKTYLSRLFDPVAAGEEIVIAEAGRPVARLVPFEPGRKPQAGLT
jgi:antitoxin (DNA-binding transcriptional repressor) of toxin-antitoxin stability system